MDWEPWLNDGFVRSVDYGGRDRSLDRIKKAWERVIAARAAYLCNDWRETDDQLRQAFVVGLHAVLLREDLEPACDYDLEIVQRVVREMFSEPMVDSIFERARILRNMMPLDPILPDTQSRLVRRSVAASSEFVALAEGYCFM